MTSDTELVASIRRTFTDAPADYICDDLALARALATIAGDGRSAADIRALIVLEAAAAGVAIAERRSDDTMQADE